MSRTVLGMLQNLYPDWLFLSDFLQHVLRFIGQAWDQQCHTAQCAPKCCQTSLTKRKRCKNGQSDVWTTLRKSCQHCSAGHNLRIVFTSMFMFQVSFYDRSVRLTFIRIWSLKKLAWDPKWSLVFMTRRRNFFWRSTYACLTVVSKVHLSRP